MREMIYKRKVVDISPTIQADYYKGAAINMVEYLNGHAVPCVIEYNNNDTMSKRKFRIRKLTERECFRLMDVKESDVDKIQASGISKSQQYKMAGNSIVVNCMYHLFRKLLVERGCEDRQLSLWG